MSEPSADEVLAQNLSARYNEIDRLEAYASGTQYAGRKSFFDDDAPLLERAPCVVVPIVKTAARSHVNMVLGEGRAPTLTSRPSEDSSVFDPRFGLTEDESAELDRGICAVEAQAHLCRVLKRLLLAGIVAKTAVAIAGVRNGKLFVDTTKAKWCTATFDSQRPEVVVELEIRYPYLDAFRDEEGKPKQRCMLYRRVIDADADTTFLPAKASPNGEEPDRWAPDPSKTVRHGLGFCPVAWYPFMPEDAAPSDHDGCAIHEQQLDEIDALNRVRSMWHRAAVYGGDPQMAEYGVSDDENPAPLGDIARAMSSGPHDHPGNANWRLPASGPNAGVGRRRGVGVINTYRNEKAHAEWLTLNANALKPLEENGDALEAMLAEAFSWVPIDAKDLQMSSNLSGRALEWLHKKQTDFCSSVRDDFGEHCYLALVDLLLRIVLAAPPGRLRLAGADKLRDLLKRFSAEVADERGTREEWFGPSLTLKWPPYFAPTEADAKATGDNVRADLDAKIITRRTAVEKLAPFYDIADVDAYLESLDEAQEEAAALAPETPPPPAPTLPPGESPPPTIPNLAPPIDPEQLAAE